MNAMMNVVGKMAVDEREQQEEERERRLRVVPDRQRRRPGSRPAPARQPARALTLPAHSSATGLGQALVTLNADLGGGSPVHRQAPLRRPPQPRPPPYEPSTPSSTAPALEIEPHFLSSAQHTFGSLKQDIARSLGRQSPTSSPPTAGGDDDEPERMKKLLLARREAVLRRREQQRQRAQELAAEVEAKVDRVARSGWRSQPPRKGSTAQLFEAEATMRQLAVASPSAARDESRSPGSSRSPRSRRSDGPSLAVRAMNWARTNHHRRHHPLKPH